MARWFLHQEATGADTIVLRLSGGNTTDVVTTNGHVAAGCVFELPNKALVRVAKPTHVVAGRE